MALLKARSDPGPTARRFAVTHACPEHQALAGLVALVAVTRPLYPPARYGAPPRRVYMQKLHGKPDPATKPKVPHWFALASAAPTP